ncbi:hypothetical protein KCU89_g6666, partial [Aureobasidium melanogenum]
LLHKEIPGFVSNRLQAAINNEAYSLISRGIVSAEDLDAAVTSGPGLRWALTGPVVTNALGGGGGVEGFANRIDRLGPSIRNWEEDMLRHSSSTDSSSTIDGLPTIAVSSIPVPEFTSPTISCDDVACVSFTIGASTTSILGAAVTDLAVTLTADTTSVPEFTATTSSWNPLMDLLCVSLAIGPSTTSTIGTAAPDGSDPTGSPVQFTTTETPATSSSVPKTTTSTSSACTPLPTSCGSNGYFTLMAVSSDSSINGQYALINGVSIGMYVDSSNAQGFCLDSNNAFVWAVTDGYAAVKSSSSGPIQIETQGNLLSCTAVPNEDCTATIQCTWYNDFRMVVDKSNYNTVYLTNGMDEDYGGSSNPVPVTLIMQSW